jgi:predicted ATP-grasp superfamily ATP-dependent carboligase
MVSVVRVLVLDGHSAAALAFVRSLGRAGRWVAVGHGEGTFAAAALSRYCAAVFQYPDPTTDLSGFATALLAFVQREKIELLVPITDWTTIPVCHYRDQLEVVCRIAPTSRESLELVSDKYRTVRLAQSLDVTIPETWLIRDVTDLDDIPSWTFPLVVKDRASVRWIGNGAVVGSVSYAYDQADLRRQIATRLAAAGDVLIQRFVGGVGVGFSCFAHGGKALLPFEWVRVRETDPRGSGSSARKSVCLDATVRQFSERLIAQVGFEGLAMVEFKRDLGTGQITLMEINGRPWGSLQLPISSGIDYPNYLVDWCLTESLPPAEINYKKGIVCRRIVGELVHLENLRRGKPAQWPEVYPNFWTSLLKVAMPWYPGMRYDDLSFSDPKPGLAGLYKWFRDRIGKGRKSQNAIPSRRVKGIIHCHTTYSYDGKLTVPELCEVLRREGFDFVALTEHTQGLTARRYSQLVRECAEQSDEKFLAVPGLELRCGDGIEIAAIGVSQWLDDSPPTAAAAAIRDAGGYAVWVHPFKKGNWSGAFLDCDAVEVLNGKEDGVLAPNLALRKEYAWQRQQGRSFHAIFGLDFHNLRQQRCVWIECETDELTRPAVVRALREGRFVSRVSHGAMSSQGKIGSSHYLKMLSLRAAFISWKALLRLVPSGVRTALLRVGSPVASTLKRRN